MLSPNRNNIYKHFFMASGCIIILSVILALTTQLSIRSMVTYGILPAALLAFVLGLLTMVTRPRRLEDGRKVAGNMVNHLLNAVAQSELGYLLTDPSSETIQIARVIEGSRVGRDLYKPLLDRIYKRVPAC